MPIQLAYSESLGHVHRERSGDERVNSRLKDSFGGRFARVQGHTKVMAHLMFGIICLTIEQVMRLVI